jgi:hypothetical protein
LVSWIPKYHEVISDRARLLCLSDPQTFNPQLSRHRHACRHDLFIVSFALGASFNIGLLVVLHNSDDCLSATKHTRLKCSHCDGCNDAVRAEIQSTKRSSVLEERFVDFRKVPSRQECRYKRARGLFSAGVRCTLFTIARR